MRKETSMKYELANEFKCAKSKVLAFININNSRFKKEDYKFYYYFLKEIGSIIKGLESRVVVAGHKRKYAVLAKMIVELPESIMDPKIGSEFIELERKLLAYNFEGVKVGNKLFKALCRVKLWVKKLIMRY